MPSHATAIDFIDRQGIGGFQIRLLLTCAAVLFLDGFELTNIGRNMFWQEMYTLWNNSPQNVDGQIATVGGFVSGRDTSVYVFNFIDDDSSVLGNEERNRYLATLQSSRLEIRGSFGASTASLSVLTNDVAPAGDMFVGSTDNSSV